MIELVYIERIIHSKNESMKWRFIHAAVIFGISMIILLFGSLSGIEEGEYGWITKIGSGLVMSITAWPINDIINKKSSLKIFKDLKKDIIYLQSNNMEDNSELERIKNIIWEAVEKLALA